MAAATRAQSNYRLKSIPAQQGGGQASKAPNHRGIQRRRWRKEGRKEQVETAPVIPRSTDGLAGFHPVGRPCKQAGRKEKGLGVLAAGATEDLRSVCGLHFIKGISEAEITCAIPHPILMHQAIEGGGGGGGGGPRLGAEGGGSLPVSFAT